MTDTVEELPNEIGYWIADQIQASTLVGDVNYAGWAGYFDMEDLRQKFKGELPENLVGLAAVIVAVWPDGSAVTEAYSNPAHAGWRWLCYEDMFRITDMPDDRDLVFSFDWDLARFEMAGFHIRNWYRLEHFLRKKLRSPKYRGRRVWYYDRPIGNYHLWEL